MLEERILYKELSYKIVGWQCRRIPNSGMVFLKEFMKMH